MRLKTHKGGFASTDSGVKLFVLVIAPALPFLFLSMPTTKPRRFRGFHLDPATDARLRHACAVRDVSVAEFIRQAILAKLNRETVSA